jgi:signal transduction histidine kinase
VPIAAWRARVSVPAAPIEAAHRKMIVAALSTSGASLALGFVLAAVLARRIARRIDDQARAKDEQFDQLIHGMRNALNALSTATDVLASADPASETAAEAREIVRRQTRALSNLLHERRPDAP